MSSTIDEEDQRIHYLENQLRQLREARELRNAPEPVPETEDTLTEEMTWLQRRETREAVNPNFTDEYEMIRSQLPLLSEWVDFMDRLRPSRDSSSLDSLTQSTLNILSTIIEENPNGEIPRLRSTRSLVVGEVQAGKTTSMTSIVAAAISLGVKAVVVLAGVTNSLRVQAQTRFEGHVLENNGRLYTPTDIGDLSGLRRDAERFNAIRSRVLRNLELRDDGISMFVTKKNTSSLQGLLDLLNSLRARNPAIFGDGPILVIDDEADHASLNMGHQIYSAGAPNLDTTTIHRRIADIVTQHNCAYIGYTATPQAQCLGMTSRDPLYPETVHVLPSHPAYLGPLDIFHHHKNRIIEPCIINDVVLPSGRRGRAAIDYLRALRDAPESFVSAVINHAVSGALHRMTIDDRPTPHGSRHAMLVHITREIDGHTEAARLIELAIERAREIIGGSDTGFIDAVRRFRCNWTDLRIAGIFPPLEDIRVNSLETLDISEMRVLNNESDDDLDVSLDDYPDCAIVVGGQILGRGQTVEGLRTSVFLRQPAERVMDSTLQAGRFFGPHQNDKHLISIHMNEELANRFENIAWMNSQLRDEIRRVHEEGLSLEDIQIWTHPGYKPTRKDRYASNVRREKSQIQIKTPYAPQTHALLAFHQSLENLESVASESGMITGRFAGRGWIWRTTLSELQSFIQNQRWASLVRNQVASMLNRIETMIRELGADHPANIVLRNGSLDPISTTYLPTNLHGSNLRMVQRASSDGRSLKEVQSGGSGGTDADWFLDGWMPSGPTARRRRWRSTSDPVLLVCYLVGEHAIEDQQLDNTDQPSIAYIAHFPHTGPGGSVVRNAGGEEE